MKKILVNIVILVMFIFLVGCGNNIEKPPIGGTDPSIENGEKDNKDQNNNDKQNDNNSNESEQNNEITVKNGNEVAKILLANERLDQSILEDSDKIFVSGKEAFSNIVKATQLSMTKLSKREGETYTEVDGDTYKWYNDVDYSNFMSYFESYVINIEQSAETAVRMIDFTKTHIRVVNTWVRIGNQETLLIVNENSEIILNRYDDGYVNICKRYTDENGKSVYEMAYVHDDYITRMKYIPGLVYEFVTSWLDGRDDNSLYLLADNSKGYWTVISANGLSSYIENGNVNENFFLQTLVMKDEATYMFDYMNSNYGIEYVGDIKIVSSDGKSDLISFSKNNITLFNTGVNGLDHLEIVAPRDKVGDFDPNSSIDLYVYEQNNTNDQGQDYKIYSTSGVKSATAVCENGVTFTYEDKLLDGKVTVQRIDVSYVAGCDSYGIIPFSTTASSLEEQYDILKELLDYTGLTFRRDYDEVIKCIEYSIKDAQKFPKYYTINGYHVNDFEQLKKGLNIEGEEYKDLLNIYEQAKNIEVVDINNQEEYDSRIHFTDLEVVNQGTTTNDEFTLSIENFEVKVEDTLLFVEGQEYQIVFGLLTVDNNVIPFINEEDSKFIYKKGEDFILSLNKNIEIPVLTEGEYILAAYVSLAGENIRTSNFVPVYGNIVETTKTSEGFKNVIKNDNENRILIVSTIDYNVYYNIQGDISFEMLQEMLAQLAYDHGMFEEIVVERLVDNNWVVYEQKIEEKENEDIHSDSSVTDGEVNEESSPNPPILEEDQSPSVPGDETVENPEEDNIGNNENSEQKTEDINNDVNEEEQVINVEKGQYRMKYIANTTEDDTEDYYIYITIE